MRSTPPRRPSQPDSETRTSYQVGRPWMFEGKMLRGLTGTPILRIAFAKSSFAEAEPEPFTLANLTTKALTDWMAFVMAISGRFLLRRTAAVAGVRQVEEELLHVPGARGAALGAQSAVQAHVLVLRHDLSGLEGPRDVEVLGRIPRRRGEAGAQVRLLAVLGESDAIHRADVHAGVALDAQPVGEHRLHVAVQAPLRFLESGHRIEAELDLDLDVLQRDRLVLPRSLVAVVGRDRVVVTPLVDTHLLAGEVHDGRRTLADVLAVQELVDRDRGVVPMGHGPDNVLRPERRVAAEEDLGLSGLHGDLVHHRHAVLVELDAAVPFDPGKGVLLPDRDQDVVALEALIRFSGGNEAASPFLVAHRLHFLEAHSGEPAVVVLEALGDEIVEDGNAFVPGVLLLPGRGLHLLEARAHDDLHVLAAEAFRRPAAVHRGIAAAQNDHAPADLVGVAEGDRRQPVDADVDVLRRFPAPGNVEVAPARRARADEDRVVILREQLLHARDLGAALEFDSEIEDIAHLLVDHFHRQAEARDLRPDHAARARVLVEYGDRVAERGEIARDGEGRGARADAGNAPAVPRRGGLRHLRPDVALVVGGDALQAADGHGFGFFAVIFLDAPTPAGGLAGTVAGAPEYPGENVGVPVDHVGVVVTPCGDQADVFGDWGMGRAGPLAIYDFVEIIRCTDISRLQNRFPPAPRLPFLIPQRLDCA